MDSKTNIPSFTVSLRGYDRVEVDEYLDSLADALSQVDDAQEQNRRLQAHIARLNGRIKDLEDRISADTPKTGAILGERIAILLRSAEDTATETVQLAEVRSAQLVAEAEQRVAEAEEAARVAVAGGQEQARRIEASARAEAAEIISEAESRAAARTRQIEQWAEQVVSHTRAEEARMLREQQAKRDAATAELRSLAEQRDAVAATLGELRETLGQALGLVVPPSQPEPEAGEQAEDRPADVGAGAPGEGPEGVTAEPGATSPAVPAPPSSDAAPTAPAGDLHAGDLHAGTAPSVVVDVGASGFEDFEDFEETVVIIEPPGASTSAETAETEAEAAAAEVESGEADAGNDPSAWWAGTPESRPPFDAEACDEAVTGQIEAVNADDDTYRGGPGATGSEDPDFEAKLEAWVSEGARHFRRM